MGNSVVQAWKNRIPAVSIFILTHWPVSKLVLGRLCWLSNSQLIQLCLTAVPWTAALGFPVHHQLSILGQDDCIEPLLKGPEFEQTPRDDGDGQKPGELQ